MSTEHVALGHSLLVGLQASTSLGTFLAEIAPQSEDVDVVLVVLDEVCTSVEVDVIVGWELEESLVEMLDESIDVDEIESLWLVDESLVVMLDESDEELEESDEELEISL